MNARCLFRSKCSAKLWRSQRSTHNDEEREVKKWSWSDRLSYDLLWSQWWRIPLLLHSNCDLHLPVACTPWARVWLYYRCGRWRSYSSNPEMRLSMTYFTKQKQVQKLPQHLYKKQGVCHHMFYLLECLHLGVCINEFCWFSTTAFNLPSCISICFSLIWQGFIYYVCINYTISRENMKSYISSSW